MNMTVNMRRLRTRLSYMASSLPASVMAGHAGAAEVELHTAVVTSMYEWALASGKHDLVEKLGKTLADQGAEKPKVVRAQELAYNLSKLEESLAAGAATYDTALCWLQELARGLGIPSSDPEYATLHLGLRVQAVLSCLRKKHDWRAGKKTLTANFESNSDVVSEHNRYKLLLNLLESAQNGEVKKVEAQVKRYPESAEFKQVSEWVRCIRATKLPRPQLMQLSYEVGGVVDEGGGADDAEPEPAAPTAQAAAATEHTDDEDGGDEGVDLNQVKVVDHKLSLTDAVEFKISVYGNPIWGTLEKHPEFKIPIQAYMKSHRLTTRPANPAAAQTPVAEAGPSEPPPTRSRPAASQPPPSQPAPSAPPVAADSLRASDQSSEGQMPKQMAKSKQMKSKGKGTGKGGGGSGGGGSGGGDSKAGAAPAAASGAADADAALVGEDDEGEASGQGPLTQEEGAHMEEAERRLMEQAEAAEREAVAAREALEKKQREAVLLREALARSREKTARAEEARAEEARAKAARVKAARVEAARVEAAKAEEARSSRRKRKQARFKARVAPPSHPHNLTPPHPHHLSPHPRPHPPTSTLSRPSRR